MVPGTQQAAWFKSGLGLRLHAPTSSWHGPPTVCLQKITCFQKVRTWTILITQINSNFMSKSSATKYPKGPGFGPLLFFPEPDFAGQSSSLGPSQAVGPASLWSEHWRNMSTAPRPDTHWAHTSGGKPHHTEHGMRPGEVVTRHEGNDVGWGSTLGSHSSLVQGKQSSWWSKPHTTSQDALQKEKVWSPNPDSWSALGDQLKLTLWHAWTEPELKHWLEDWEWQQ